MAQKAPPPLTSYRPILPAGGGDDGDTVYPVAAKRKVTTVACKPCQRKKRKCDGGRPRCSACTLSGAKTECTYDTRGGQSRSDAMKERMTELQSENSALKRIIGDPGDQQGVEGSDLSMVDNTALPTSQPEPQSHDERVSSIGSTSPLSTSVSVESSKSKIAHFQSDVFDFNAVGRPLQAQSGASIPLWQPRSDEPDSEVVRAQREQQRRDGVSQAQHLTVEQSQQGQESTTRYASPYVYQPRKRGRYLELFGNLPLPSAIQSNRFPGSIQTAQPQSLHLPVYLIQMLNWDDIQAHESILTPEFASCTLSTFRAYGRRSLADGVSESQILGAPDRPDIDVQQFFQIRIDHELVAHTTATFAPWFLGAYPSMTLVVKVACAILVQALLRWQIHPTSANYEALPEWLRATGSQTSIPHQSAFDFLPCIKGEMLFSRPEIRDLLIGDIGSSREILVLIISNLAVEWGGSVEDIFLWDYRAGLPIRISPDFVTHVRDLNNWAINIKVLDMFPVLEGKARFVDLGKDLEEEALRATRQAGQGTT